MVALSLSIGLGSMIGSFRQSLVWWMDTQLRGDLYISTITEKQVPEDFYEEIKAMYVQAGAGGGEKPPQAEGAVPDGMSEMIYTNLKIDLQGDRAAATLLWHSVSSDLLTSPPKITEYGRERTELVKQDGRWLISKRVILSEGGMPEGLLTSYPKQ
jgi:hypothetical protein